MAVYKSNGMEKDDEDRIRRNDPRISPSELVDDGALRGPELPECPDRQGWCQRTLEWYEMWRKSPNSKLFADTDWESLVETALLHNRVWNPAIEISHTAMVNMSSEIRRRVAVWGATHYDRIQLKLKIRTPQQDDIENAQVAKDAVEAVNYMEALAKAAAEAKLTE